MTLAVALDTVERGQAIHSAEFGIVGGVVNQKFPERSRQPRIRVRRQTFAAAPLR